mmetsp:Transcript_19451/g.26311  ORF Transcript_19451/g.26311 Transcript_19451/m.26311 type:complete len:163 (+) Transcript_19451:18-506(+)
MRAQRQEQEQQQEEPNREQRDRKALFETLMSYTGTVIAVTLCILALIFAVYGFVSPDPRDCFAFPGVNEPSRDVFALKKLAYDAGLKDQKGYPLNMGRVFRIWFQWGFFTVLVTLWLSILLFYPAFRKAMGVAADAILVLLGAVSSLNGFFWLILGAVWRFS